MLVQIAKKSSKGFLGKKFNLQSRKVQFFVVILIVAILGGGYFTYKSFAATEVTYTNGNIYDLWNSSYASINSPRKDEGSIYLTNKVAAAFPNECKSSGYTIMGNIPPQTWSQDRTVIYCYSKESTLANGNKLATVSTIHVGINGSNPQIVKQDSLLINGSSPDTTSRSISAVSYIKDGSMSKFAFIENRGVGVNRTTFLGIYDVNTKNTVYHNMSPGGIATEWSPDNTFIKYIQNSTYANGYWGFQTCTVALSGGNPKCEDISKGQPLGWIQDAVFSYNLDTFYFRTMPNGGPLSFYSYTSSAKLYNKILADPDLQHASILHYISPDSRFILLSQTGKANYQAYDTSNKTFVNTTIPYNSHIFWQAIKATPTTGTSKNNPPTTPTTTPPQPTK